MAQLLAKTAAARTAQEFMHLRALACNGMDVATHNLVGLTMYSGVLLAAQSLGVAGSRPLSNQEDSDMKISKPGLTLLMGAMLVGLAGCSGDDRVADAENRDADARPLPLVDNQTRVAPGLEVRTDSIEDVADRNDAGGTELSNAAIATGVIPQDLVGEDSRLNRLAIARLNPTAGNLVSGLVSFIETEGEDGIRIIARINGLADGEHGIHIHESGDCSAPDASSAGSHFNPDDNEHAAREASERHAGDLGNIRASGQVASLDITDEVLSFSGENSVVGKAFIVHAGRDDLSTQPSGNSGDPVACGVVQLQDATAISRRN